MVGRGKGHVTGGGEEEGSCDKWWEGGRIIAVTGGGLNKCSIQGLLLLLVGYCSRIRVKIQLYHVHIPGVQISLKPSPNIIIQANLLARLYKEWTILHGNIGTKTILHGNIGQYCMVT